MRRVDEAQLATLRADPALVPEFALEDEKAQAAGDIIDFDKAWHALHFILTGRNDEVDSPLSLLSKEYETLGEDLGNGPPQLISAANMLAFHEALSKISDDELHARYDPETLGRADVYLGDVFAEEGEEMWDYIAQGIPALRKLADTCAATGSGVMVTIC